MSLAFIARLGFVHDEELDKNGEGDEEIDFYLGKKLNAAYGTIANHHLPFAFF